MQCILKFLLCSVVCLSGALYASEGDSDGLGPMPGWVRMPVTEKSDIDLIAHLIVIQTKVMRISNVASQVEGLADTTRECIMHRLALWHDAQKKHLGEAERRKL